MVDIFPELRKPSLQLPDLELETLKVRTVKSVSGKYITLTATGQLGFEFALQYLIMSG